MEPPGYLPSRDQMRAIVDAARTLHRIVRRWQDNAELPGFPVERGNVTAARALFALERALNPGRLAWGHDRREDPHVQCWDREVGDGIVWLRSLANLIMQRNRLQAMAVEPRYEAWRLKSHPLPSVSVQADELRALRAAIRMLPPPEQLPEPGPSAAIEPVMTRPADPAGDGPRVADAPVLLFGPDLPPIVLGRRKKRLGYAQYRVIKAILDSEGHSLGKAQLRKVTGDAVNVLKRLAASDADWRAVIKLPGRSGLGYQIAPPEPTRQAIEGTNAQASPDGPPRMEPVEGW